MWPVTIYQPISEGLVSSCCRRIPLALPSLPAHGCLCITENSLVIWCRGHGEIADNLDENGWKIAVFRPILGGCVCAEIAEETLEEAGG